MAILDDMRRKEREATFGGRLKTLRLDAGLTQEQRRARIEEAISAGLERLNDPDPTRANIWLRTHLRLWADNQQVVSIEWL